MVRYEISPPTAAESMTVGHPEWLRALASRYGGLPGEGRYHYYEEDGSEIPKETVGDMAESPVKAAADLRLQESRGTQGAGTTDETTTVDPEALLVGRAEEVSASFADGRKRFVRMGRIGQPEVIRRGL